MSTFFAITCSSLAVFLLCYLCGSIPFGYIIGKFNGLDIRQHGSHNIGATNVSRILGKDWGYTCFVFDFLKGFLPVLIIGQHYAADWAIGASVGGIIGAIGAICGHIFPYWLKFKGGKGVATSLGIVCCLAWLPLIFGLVAWLGCYYFLGRIVSIASMAAVCVMAIAGIVLAFVGMVSIPVAIILTVLAALVVIRHKENIKRLLNGSENSFVKVKKK